MESELHKSLIDWIVEEEDAKIKRFKSAVFSSLDDNDFDDAACDAEKGGYMKWFYEQYIASTGGGVIPDAYKIIKEERKIICYEVVVTCELNERRHLKYHNWDWFLDVAGWFIELRIYNRSRDYQTVYPIFDFNSMFPREIANNPRGKQ